MQRFKGLSLVLVFTLVFIGIALLATSSILFAVVTEVWVDADFDDTTPGWGITHFASVQAGINAVVEGGTVNVAAGTYQECIVNKPLTLQGEDGAILDGDGNHMVVLIETPGVTVRNIALQRIGSGFDGIHVNYDLVAEYVNANPGAEKKFIFTGVIMDGGGVGRAGIRFESGSGVHVENYEITILNNTISNFNDIGIHFRRGIADSYVIIEQNIITVNNNSLHILNDIQRSNLTVHQNTFNSNRAVHLNRNALESEVTVTSNNITSNFTAINIYEFTGGTVTVEANNIMSSQEGIRLNKVVQSTATVKGNNVTAGLAGLHVSDRGESNISIDSNIINSVNYGMTLNQFDLCDSVFMVTNNTITAESGIQLWVSDTSEISSLMHIKGNRFIDNDRGLELWCYLGNTGSELVIAYNSFRNNRIGFAIYEEDFYIMEEVLFLVTANSFTGSTEYGIQNLNQVTWNAYRNWWGAADGPAGPGSGDPVANVSFDPWLASLEISPENGAENQGSHVSFTATLLDSDHNIMAAEELLEVRFTVTGLNNITHRAPFQGVSVFTYTSTVPGTDTITAEVLFAGESTGLSAETTMKWERIPVPRLVGINRYNTAVEVSQWGWPYGAATVFLTRGDNFPDSLAGVSLAYQLNAPILLTTTNALHSSTREEIERLGANRVIILGGPAAIAPSTEASLLALDTVETVDRISGTNRYDTAQLVAEQLYQGGSFDTAFLASGVNFADALAAASYAAMDGYPILLTVSEKLPNATVQALNQLADIQNVVIVGGEAVISPAVESELEARGLVVQRIAGPNRYATALELAGAFLPADAEEIFITTGLNFPDALAGGVLAAKRNSGILLVRGDLPALPQNIRDFIMGRNIIQATILGGTSAVSTGIEDDLKSLLE